VSRTDTRAPPTEAQSFLSAAAQDTTALSTVAPQDPRVAETQAAIRWGEQTVDGVFEGQFQLVDRLPAFVAVILILRCAVQLGTVIQLLLAGEPLGAVIYANVLGLIFPTLAMLWMATRAYGRYTVRFESTALLIVRRSLLGLNTQRASIAHESCFGVGVRRYGQRWVLVLINWDGEVTATSVQSRDYRAISFLAGRVNQVITERRTRAHYR
jgi:hypothetical protein